MGYICANNLLAFTNSTPFHEKVVKEIEEVGKSFVIHSYYIEKHFSNARGFTIDFLLISDIK